MAIQHLLTAEAAPKKAGVYAIVCEPTGKRYVGSSINIRERLYEHTRALNKHASNSRLLQNAWNKYSALAFHFEVLELAPPSRILRAEQRRAAFLKNSAPLRKAALKLSEQGVKQREIARKLGLVYQSHVSRLIQVEKELRGLH